VWYNSCREREREREREITPGIHLKIAHARIIKIIFQNFIIAATLFLAMLRLFCAPSFVYYRIILNTNYLKSEAL